MSRINVHVLHDFTHLVDNRLARRFNTQNRPCLHDIVGFRVESIHAVRRHALFQPVSFDKKFVNPILRVDDSPSSLRVAQDLDVRKHLLKVSQPKVWVGTGQGDVGFAQAGFAARAGVHVYLNMRMRRCNLEIGGPETPVRFDSLDDFIKWQLERKVFNCLRIDFDRNVRVVAGPCLLDMVNDVA